MKKVLLLTAAMLLPMTAKAETIQDVLQQMRDTLAEVQEISANVVALKDYLKPESGSYWWALDLLNEYKRQYEEANYPAKLRDLMMQGARIGWLRPEYCDFSGDGTDLIKKAAVCYSDNKCIGFRDVEEGHCYDCSYSDGVSHVVAEECAVCSKISTPREMYVDHLGLERCGLACPDGQIHDEYGHCVYCSSSDGLWFVSAEECAKCSKTSSPRMIYFNPNFNICSLICPPGQFHDFDGRCVECSDTGSFWITAEECEECSGTSNPREMYRSENYGDYFCAPACPPGQFHDNAGYCTNCSDTEPYFTSSEECAKCNDTRTPREIYRDEYYGDLCALSCPSGQFHDHGGRCVYCSDTTPHIADSEECAKCSETSNPREMYQSPLRGSMCAPVCSEKQFHNMEGYCLDCSDSSEVWDVTPEECAKCDNTSTPREMRDGQCVLKNR